MATNGIDRRLRQLEKIEAERTGPAVWCADALFEWANWQQAAGDPGGLIAQATAELAQSERNTVRAWQIRTAPQTS